MNTTNKVAIVTGAGQGIGQGIALQLAADGYTVIASDINLTTSQETVALIEKSGGMALAVKTDVSQKSEVDALIAQTITTYGQLDALVNNAGVYPFTPFFDMKEEDWDKVIDINLKSVFLCCQAAAKVMHPGAKIVTISSIASFIGYQGLVHYCATKGGINAFTPRSSS